MTGWVLARILLRKKGRKEMDQLLLISLAMISMALVVAKLAQAADRQAHDAHEHRAAVEPPTASAKLDFSFKSKSASVRLKLALELFLERFASLIDRLLARE
jgi:hypothetical protein